MPGALRPWPWKDEKTTRRTSRFLRVFVGGQYTGKERRERKRKEKSMHGGGDRPGKSFHILMFWTPDSCIHLFSLI